VTAPVLMVQGTASGVGKSVLVAALCRVLRRRGLRVAPFKAQNMSNNAAVTADGGEIGRSTAVQAAAAGTEPSVAMNPILLKPEADARSQVVVLGRAAGSLSARAYLDQTGSLWPVVADALDGLRARFDVVVAEGAGSPAELNLRDRDIVNMRVARHADAAVLLVGDIERGGVFAQLLGTLDLLEPADRRLVRGLVVNRFRGDPSLFADGADLIAARAGVPLLGVVPMVDNLSLPEEDGAVLEAATPTGAAGAIPIVVVRLPRIANFDEFAPLGREAGVVLEYSDRPERIGDADLVVLPGTKATVADLAWLRRRGIAEALVAAQATGTPILGVCGGYQMLGRAIHDPLGVEGPPGSVTGLGLLPHETTFRRGKRVARVGGTVIAERGPLAAAAGLPFSGYEIRAGWPDPLGQWRPVLRIDDGSDQSAAGMDGLVDDEGSVTGTSVHGVLEEPVIRQAVVGWLRRRAGGQGRSTESRYARSAAVHPADPIDRWADVVESCLDMEPILAMLPAGRVRR
jgi:adenosylcobyric acid synthase